jgi:hypothetical protein
VWYSKKETIGTQTRESGKSLFYLLMGRGGKSDENSACRQAITRNKINAIRNLQLGT